MVSPSGFPNLSRITRLKFSSGIFTTVPSANSIFPVSYTHLDVYKRQDYSLWNKIIDSNLNGTYLCSVRAAKIMKKQKEGKIISISSIAGTRAAAGMGVYGIAKAAIEMLTKVLAAELAGDGIRVNAVAPCMVKTDFSRPFWSDPALLAEIEKTIPLSRIAEPADIVKVVLFLSSPASDFITGQTITVDGGATAI